MAKIFTYRLTATVNDMVAIDQIRFQISDSSIAVLLEDQPAGVMCDFTTVTFTFEADLSTADVTTLDGIVAAHTGTGLFQLGTLEIVPKADLLAITYAEQGWMAFVPDDVTGPVPAYYDGTDWRIVTTGALVS